MSETEILDNFKAALNEWGINLFPYTCFFRPVLAIELEKTIYIFDAVLLGYNQCHFLFSAHDKTIKKSVYFSSHLIAITNDAFLVLAKYGVSFFDKRK